MCACVYVCSPFSPFIPNTVAVSPFKATLSPGQKSMPLLVPDQGVLEVVEEFLAPALNSPDGEDDLNFFQPNATESGLNDTGSAVDDEQLNSEYYSYDEGPDSYTADVDLDTFRSYVTGSDVDGPGTSVAAQRVSDETGLFEIGRWRKEEGAVHTKSGGRESHLVGSTVSTRRREQSGLPVTTPQMTNGDASRERESTVKEGQGIIFTGEYSAITEASLRGSGISESGNPVATPQVSSLSKTMETSMENGTRTSRVSQKILQNLEEPDFMLVPKLNNNRQQSLNLQSTLLRMRSDGRKHWLKSNWKKFQILQVDNLSKRFQDRMRQFLCVQDVEVLENQKSEVIAPDRTASLPDSRHVMAANSQTLKSRMIDSVKDVVQGQKYCRSNGDGIKGHLCSMRFFLTWMSPVSSFSPRERLSLESVFKWHPRACVVIISRTMDSNEGRVLLQPFVQRGYRIMAVTPDLTSLFSDTPAARWLHGLRDGTRDPGSINLMQNLSNIMRLAALYKYGGIYIDTDIILLKSLSGLHNVVGAQSNNAETGEWTRLNNAVLLYDIKHPVIYQLMKEFAKNFDGNKWGYNGPYLVSRVMHQLEGLKKGSLVSVLQPQAFYPVNWKNIPFFFKYPATRVERKWQEAELERLRLHSYAIHLWNKKSSALKVSKGSIMEIVFRHACILCKATGS